MRLTIILLLVSSVCFGQGIKTNNQTGGTNTVVQNGSEIKNADMQSVPKVDTKATLIDTLNAPLISIKEVQDFLFAINRKFVAMRELDLIKENEYKQLIGELNKIVAVLEKKKKTFK